METDNLRKNWIDAAKAIAMFIVVLNHSGLMIPGVNFWGGMFFVPAFFVLSGYTYHVSTDSFGSFLKRKAKRLLLPYAVANGFLFLFYFCLRLYKKIIGKVPMGRFVPTSLAGILYGRSCLFPGREDSCQLMINLNAPTWFLPALFVALVITEGLFRLFREDEKKVLAVIAVYALAGVIYHYFCPLLLPFCLDVMPFFLLMMYAGYRLKKVNMPEAFSDIPLVKRLLILCIPFVILIPSGLINGSVNLSLSNTGKSIFLMLLSAVSSSIILVFAVYFLERKCTKAVCALAKVGRHTLTILCYHYFILRMAIDAGAYLFPEIFAHIKITVFQIIYKIVCMAVSIAACVVLDVIHEHRKRNFISKNEIGEL